MKDTAGVIRREIEEVNTLLFMRTPFLAVLLRRARIILSGDVQTACVTTAGELLLNPFFWQTLSDVEVKTFVLLHEALHLGFRHPWLSLGRNTELYNTAADMVVNEMLLRHGFKPPRWKLVTAVTVYESLNRSSRNSTSRDELKRSSAEEVYRLLNLPGRPVKIPEERAESLMDLSDKQKQDGIIVQEGTCNEEEPEERWRMIMSEALVIGRNAGMLPGNIARQVSSSMKPRIDWRSILRVSLLEGTGRLVVNTWQYPSRRNPFLPGIKRLGLQTIRVLIDCSGSISEETLKGFVSEIQSIAATLRCGLNVTPWDAGVYPSVRTSGFRFEDHAMRCLPGGGGTVLQPALKQLYKETQNQDIALILSDGYIADINAKDTLDLYRKVARRAAMMIFVTTGSKPRLPCTKIIALE
ncbi:MAG: VWA-like domain-containing protein [Bacillota bacterium]